MRSSNHHLARLSAMSILMSSTTSSKFSDGPAEALAFAFALTLAFALALVVAAAVFEAFEEEADFSVLNTLLTQGAPETSTLSLSNTVGLAFVNTVV